LAAGYREGVARDVWTVWTKPLVKIVDGDAENVLQKRKERR